MNVTRIGLAALAALVAYFAMGGVFFALPAMRAEFGKYSSVYRSQESIRRVMPFGMFGMLISMIAVAVLFAMIHPTGAGVGAGVEFGGLLALFALGSFVIHNHVNLNVGARLTGLQAIAYSVEWIAVGVLISLVYRG